MILQSLETFIEIAKSKAKKSIAVAAAEDKPVLQAIKEASKLEIVDPILIGNKNQIKNISDEIEFDLTNISIIESQNPAKSALEAVHLVREGSAQILMKGMVGTADYLRAILNKEIGLRKGSLLSHVGFFQSESYHKVFALTDAAQNISPDLNEKISIINNSIDFFHSIGINKPKIALLAAIEGVNPKMQATIDAATITMMNIRNQIKGCIIDGPLAFDNAISKEAAEHKGIHSDVAGDVDLLVTPEIVSGNVLYKSFTYIGKATVAAIILGASVPIVLTSRADSDKSKLMSIALAASY